MYTNSSFDLYNSHYIEDLFPAIKNNISTDVSTYSDSELANQDINDIANKLFDKYSLDYPEIHVGQAHITTYEKEIPAERFPFEFNVFYGKTYKKDVIVYHIPYSGDIDILKFRPNPFTLSGGSIFTIDRNEKCLLLDVINFYDDKEKIKKSFDNSLRYLVDRNYNTLKENCSAFNSTLKNEILSIIAIRKNKIEEKKQFLSDLVVPMKKPIEKEKTETVTIATPMKKKREIINYDLAISFAGEDRTIAEKIADKLISLGYSIFYDKYEQANLWGKDLYTHLNDVYSNKAKYCLMIISSSYEKKHWTNHERQAAQAKAFTQNEEYILPLRLDDTKIPGINITVGYVDYNQTGFDETIKLLVDKIAK
jgi:TIR domain